MLRHYLTICYPLSTLPASDTWRDERAAVSWQPPTASGVHTAAGDSSQAQDTFYGGRARWVRSSASALFPFGRGGLDAHDAHDATTHTLN